MLDDHPFADGISSPIAAHIFDFCDNGSGGDLFTAVNVASDLFTAPSEDASSSSVVTTPPAPCGHGDDMPLGTAAAPAASAFSPMPSFDSTLSALLEEEDPSVPNPELLLPIDYPFAAAAAGDEPHPEQQQQQFAQVPVMLPLAGAAQHPGLQTHSTASELMQLDECFAAAMAGGGGYVGLNESMCQQPQPGALFSTTGGMMETGAPGCYFDKDMAAAAAAQGGFLGTGCNGMMMSIMGMEEIGEYQRMMEGASDSLAGTHIPDADCAAAAQMAFSGNAVAGEMQMGGSMSPGRLPAATATEASSLEDANFKSARITVEERREKIIRYIKKRNKRNFRKKIKYACRKTLADSRPRVRGRFAKNDDYGEPSSRVMQNHEEYDQMAASMKAEDILDPDAAHFNGMNSYLFNHTVESWL
ncbi:uncharacterized protein LOC100283743 [Zea mays]|uniref:CCT motif family protein n=1 Tax=Zea mays TaxID=4577 RepID=B6TLA4_MAIZE|nr:uncharacterized protein LOC100283743 [Zea mays]ACG37887.1 CCT motif family protein [Zea mays]|eukprot:NP_001150114.1 CCT motif family protein [Zea mays]